MKKPIYVSALFALTLSFFNCAPETESLTDDLSVINVNDADLFTTRSNKVLNIPDSDACFKFQLEDKKDQPYGLMLIGLTAEDISFSFNTESDWKITETYLSMIDCGTGAVPSAFINGVVNPDFFEFSDVHPEGRNTVEYNLDVTTMNEKVCFAALAVVEHLKFGKKYVMVGEWLESVSVNLPDCKDYVPNNWIRECVQLDDLDFFIPLSNESSGDYPEAGTSSDQVTITPDYPSTSGYVIMNMVFDNIPEGMNDIELSMSFSDLDLVPDVINSGSNVAVFSEWLVISDMQGRNLVMLDESSLLDGDFDFVLPLDKDLIQNGKISLQTKFYSHLELQAGPGLTASNSIEGCYNVKICGLVNNAE